MTNRELKEYLNTFPDDAEISLILANPRERKLYDVENAFAELIKEKYPECEILMGTSTAGIAHAAITAHILGKPMGYVRAGAKDHGRNSCSVVVAQHQHNTDTGKTNRIIKMHIHNNHLL